jgi:hypothetical protein
MDVHRLSRGRLPTHKKWAPRAHFAKPVKCGGFEDSERRSLATPPRGRAGFAGATVHQAQAKT